MAHEKFILITGTYIYLKNEESVNMTKDEFTKHFSILLKNAINYTRLYAVLTYFELKRQRNSILSYISIDEIRETDEIREVIKQYEKELKYYKNLYKELEVLIIKEIESENINKKFE